MVYLARKTNLHNYTINIKRGRNLQGEGILVYFI